MQSCSKSFTLLLLNPANQTTKSLNAPSPKCGDVLGPSFRRRPESSLLIILWTPAFAGVTTQVTARPQIRDRICAIAS